MKRIHRKRSFYVRKWIAEAAFSRSSATRMSPPAEWKSKGCGPSMHPGEGELHSSHRTKARYSLLSHEPRICVCRTGGITCFHRSSPSKKLPRFNCYRGSFFDICGYPGLTAWARSDGSPRFDCRFVLYAAPVTGSRSDDSPRYRTRRAPGNSRNPAPSRGSASGSAWQG